MALGDPATLDGTLASCREDIAKTLLFFHTLGQKEGNAPLADVYSVVEGEEFRPLSTGELMATLTVLAEDGDLPNSGMALFEAQYELVKCADVDSDEGRAIRARLSAAEPLFLRNEAVEEIRRHLRHADAVKAREAAAFWRDAPSQPETTAVRQRLVWLRAEAQRLAALNVRLASIMRPTSVAAALVSSAEAEAWRASAREIDRLLRQAMDFLDKGLAIQQLGRNRMLAMRSARRHEVSGRRTSVLVDARTGQPVNVTEVARRDNAAQATLGQAAETVLGWVSKLVGETTMGAFCTGAQIEAALRPQLRDLVQLSRQGVVLGAEDSALLARASDVVDIAVHLKVSEGASPLRFEQVQERDRHKLLYAWLAQEYVFLQTALSASVKRLRKRRRRAAPSSAGAAGQAAKTTPASEAGQASSEAAGAACSAADFARQMAQAWLDSDPEPLGAHDDHNAEASREPWSAAGRRAHRRPLSAAGVQKVGESFYGGTFASPVQSLIYHFRKHTRRPGEAPPPLEESLLLGYIASAQAARARWTAASAAGDGYLAKNRLDPSLSLRVIDDEEVYLVMTDEPDPKIVSFRDRKQVGRV